jgi:hypothetical protein
MADNTQPISPIGVRSDAELAAANAASAQNVASPAVNVSAILPTAAVNLLTGTLESVEALDAADLGTAAAAFREAARSGALEQSVVDGFTRWADALDRLKAKKGG